MTIDVDEKEYMELKKVLIDEKKTIANFIRDCIKSKIKKK